MSMFSGYRIKDDPGGCVVIGPNGRVVEQYRKPRVFESRELAEAWVDWRRAMRAGSTARSRKRLRHALAARFERDYAWAVRDFY